MNKGLFTSNNACWGTPQELFRALDGEFHFGLDAAATADNAKCSRFFSPEEDGLTQSWDVGAGVFCNPPYGREIWRWVQKAHQEFCVGGGGANCAAAPRPDGYTVVPGFYLRQGGAPLPAGAGAIYG